MRSSSPLAERSPLWRSDPKYVHKETSQNKDKKINNNETKVKTSLKNRKQQYPSRFLIQKWFVQIFQHKHA